MSKHYPQFMHDGHEIIQNYNQIPGYPQAYKHIEAVELRSLTVTGLLSEKYCIAALQNMPTEMLNTILIAYCPSEYQEGLEISYLARRDCCHKKRRRKKKVKSASNASEKNLRNTSSVQGYYSIIENK